MGLLKESYLNIRLNVELLRVLKLNSMVFYYLRHENFELTVEIIFRFGFSINYRSLKPAATDIF
ncbi:MAG: hypothetical protein A2000_09970 [Ignavibacteria bacterium GWB2_36_8]|nr:MAG: hypothetical protein A2000_09970 [Ignavibacteria bacterium GWB2_36_8]OGU51234.1 MAG: hypothetical protein A2080_12920 [Ignavibacteria bacterium GWC2_36_12]OGV16408.1 MAG: hypothetical protein A3J84_07175 [Ignavibacteria bacterium RIFOXYA2_FULL_37_17]